MQFVLKEIFDKNLGVPLPEKSYADDCRVYTPENEHSKFANIVGGIDVFVAAHFIGWTFKTWIFRNQIVAWLMSICFELIEMTMGVWLNNFHECWWDHIFYDLFGCNLLGMMIGVWTINAFGMRKLHWFLEPNEKMEKMTFWQKFKYTFTSREEYIKKGKWHWLAEPWNLTALLWFFSLNFLLDLSFFFNKTNLEIPPPHFLMAVRIYILGFFCILAAHDYYDYITKRRANAMGINAFLIHIWLILEFCLWLKHLDCKFTLNLVHKIFNDSPPAMMRTFWYSLFSLISVAQIYLWIDKKRRTKKYSAE